MPGIRGVAVVLALLSSLAEAAQRAAFEAVEGVAFRNQPSKTSQKYLPESMVGGVALLDYDLDGDLDVFFVNGAALSDPMDPGEAPDKAAPRFWNRLYRNDGDFRFSDVTEKTGLAGRGYGQGAAAGDFDNDGDPDLYVTNFGRNILYENRDGTFFDVTEKRGAPGGGWSGGAAFLDFDRDGDLDLFVARYVAYDFQSNPFCGERGPAGRAYCHPDQFEPVTHLLYRNDSDAFRDVSEDSGIATAPGKGLGVALNDFDGDGWVDILVANDSFPQQLFRNQGDGTFEEMGLLAGLAYDADGDVFAGMGVDFEDFDRDGRPDVFINALALQGYALYRNRGDYFDYASVSTGVARITERHSGWGTKFIDYDNDGRRDIFVAQGHVMDNIERTSPGTLYEEALLMMRNTGEDFEDVSAAMGPAFGERRAARGAAFGDLNDDGFVDIVVNANDQPALVLRNTGNKNHWLQIRLVGVESNRDGIGAQVRVVTGSGRELSGFISRAGSYLSSNDPRAHFGLGGETAVRSVEVRWPSGVMQIVKDPPIDRTLTLTEPAK